MEISGAGGWLDELVRAHDDRNDAIQAAYQLLRDSTASDGVSYLTKATVHRYICRRGEVVATVFRADGINLCAVRDYKYSPGMNAEQSVPSARVKNTIDGNRHWPGHVYDVDDLARWEAAISMNCRHFHGNLFAVDILAAVEGIRPGHPGKPTILGTP